MKSIAAAWVFVLVALASLSCTSAELCPPTDQNLMWSSACFEGSGTSRKVKPEYASNIIANKAGNATIVIGNPREMIAVDRSGAVKVPHIFHTGDFDFPNASESIGRFQITAGVAPSTTLTKCGYFDGRSFEIKIPAAYDHCLAFADGVATVCNQCAQYCTEPDCQNSVLVGGEGLAVDKSNRIVRRFALPPLEKACGGTAGKIVQISERNSYLQCPPSAAGPFDQLR